MNYNYSNHKVKKIKALFQACRPNQWTKNLIIFSIPIFAFSKEPLIWFTTFKSFLVFCIVSSSIYLINDCIDKKEDKKHPWKKLRPIASDLVSINSALLLSFSLLFIGLIIAMTLNQNFLYILVFYIILQISYCFYLKNIPLVEFFCIASGFIIRSVAGGLASELFISSWFFLCLGMLSLFIALEKRKAEILTLNNLNILTRKVLNKYSIKLIDKFQSILSSCTVITYSLWTINPIVGNYKSPWMILTIPLVIMGIFRYQMIGERFIDSNKTQNILETPENVIIYDRPIQIIIFSWLFIIIFIGLLS